MFLRVCVALFNPDMSFILFVHSPGDDRNFYCHFSKSLGQGLCAGSGSSSDFLSSTIHLQAFLPVLAVSCSFIWKPLPFLNHLSLKICYCLEFHSPRSSLGASFCSTETRSRSWSSS